MNKDPLVSVVMPAYNHADYIERGVNSVLQQTYLGIELIVVDDGSTDETWKVLECLLEKSNYSFKVIRKENGGVCSALNLGIANSQGDFISIIASDDYFLPTKIEEQIRFFGGQPDSVALVHTSAYLDYQNGQALEDITGSYKPAVGACVEDVLTQKVRIVAPSIMFKRSVYDLVGGFDEELAAEDVDFFMRLAEAGYEFSYINRPLVVKTVVDKSAGSKFSSLIDVHEKILEKHRPRLTESQYSNIKKAMYDHLIILCAASGDYTLARKTALNLFWERKSIAPLFKFALWSVRGYFLSIIPSDKRHNLRLIRSGINNFFKK